MHVHSPLRRTSRRRLSATYILLGTTAGAALFAACGSSKSSVFGGGDGDGTTGGATSGSTNGGTTGSATTFGPGDTTGSSTTGGEGGNPLAISPTEVEVTCGGSLTAPSGGATFSVINVLTGQPVPAAEITWSLDSDLGSFAADGTFTCNGVRGETRAYATATVPGVGVTSAFATVKVKVAFTDDTSGLGSVALTDDERALLKAGGDPAGASPPFRWVYPYDKTVWPRGLKPPILMFSGTEPKAYYVSVDGGADFSYSGFFDGNAADTTQARLPMPEVLWRMLGLSGLGSVKVKVTKLVGGVARGPIEETWYPLGASLRGTIYYNTYKSATSNAGAIYKIRPGSPGGDAVPFITNVNVASSGPPQTRYCTVCHSVSGDGSVIVSGIDWSSGNPVYSGAYDVSPTGWTKRTVTDNGRLFSFGGLTFDGRWMLVNGVRQDGERIRGLSKANFSSRVVDTATGATLDDGFFRVDGRLKGRMAITPAFSPDGTRVAFGDQLEDTEQNREGRRLAFTTVDLSGAVPAFGNTPTRLVDTNGGSNLAVAWPSFTPDSRYVVYHEGDNYDTGKHSRKRNLGAAYADIKMVDTQDPTKKWPLETLNGYTAAGAARTYYLPFSDDQKADYTMSMNYEPTVLPKAVGGFYWVVFTSRRSYGNKIWDGPGSTHVWPGTDPTRAGSGDRPFDNSACRFQHATSDGVNCEALQTGALNFIGNRKQLWVAAVRLNPEPGQDPSTPAFHLSEQEEPEANMRAFWALDPCKPTGESCETGDDCCEGFCRKQGGQATATCSARPPTATCSNVSERCESDIDCCGVGQGVKCINRSCAQPPPAIQ